MRLLALRFGPIGDLLRLLPFFRAMKKAFPGGQTDWVTDDSALGGLLDGHPDIGRVLRFPVRDWNARGLAAFWKAMRSQRYDATLDLQGNFRSAALARLARAGRRVGCEPSREGARWLRGETLRTGGAWHELQRALAASVGARWEPDWSLPLSPVARDGAARWFSENIPSGAPAMYLFPGSRPSKTHGTRRRWPEENFAALGRRLHESTGARVIAGHGPGEEELARRVVAGAGAGAVLAPAASLPMTAALISRCALYAGGDTGITHLAWLLRVPTLFVYRIHTHQAPPPDFGLPVAEAHVPENMPGGRALDEVFTKALSLWRNRS